MSDDIVIMLSLRENTCFQIERKYLLDTGEFFTRKEFREVEVIELPYDAEEIELFVNFLMKKPLPQNPEQLNRISFFLNIFEMTKTLERFKEDRKFLEKPQGGGIFPTTILILGGTNGKQQAYNKIIKYIKNNKNKAWVEIVSWRDSRAYFGLTQIGEYTMYAGGIKDGMCRKDAMLCKLSARKQMENILKSFMFNARSKFSLVTLGEFVYAVGGEDGDGRVLRTVERWNQEENDWSDVEPMPEAKSGSCAAVLDDKIYVVGVENLISYDPKKNKWETVAKLLTDGTGHSIAAHDGCIYLIGGPTKSFYSYNTRTDSWAKCQSPLTEATEDVILARDEDHLYAIAGRYKDSKNPNNYINSKKVCRYNFYKMQWTSIPILPYVILGPNVIVIPNKIYNEN